MKQHGPECKGTYGVLCLNCGERVDVSEAGEAINLAAERDRLVKQVAELAGDVQGDLKDLPGNHLIATMGNLSVACMDPEARDLLDRAIEAWEKHKEGLPTELGGEPYRPDVYAFAYWLFRWSGLVGPTGKVAE